MCNLYSGMSLSLKHSKDYHNLLNNVIENELAPNNKPNNEVLWVHMGNQLEIEQIPMHEISTIMRKDIEDKLYEKQFKEFMPREEYFWHSGHYFSVVKKNGWTRAYTTGQSPAQDKDNSSIYAQNKDMIFLCDDIINICRFIKQKSKDSKPFEDILGKKLMKEFYQQRRDMMENCKNAIDEKTKIPENTEMFLLESLATVLGNTNKCGEVFQEVIMKHMKDQGKFLTSKQANKFQNGEKQSKLLILKPISWQTAVYAGYIGIQCTCGSWRIREQLNSNNFECFDCERTIIKECILKCTHCKIPLINGRMKYVKNTGKCQDCQGVVELPEEVIGPIK